MTDLLILGDCKPDVLVAGRDALPVYGRQEKQVAGMSLVIGGSAAITAVAAARLGLRVALAVSGIMTLGIGLYPEPFLRLAQTSLMP